MALVALLTGVYHISRRRTGSLLSDVFGVSMSLGAISAVERRVSEAVVEPVEEARAVVDAAPVKHADATSWLEAGKLRSLWVLATVAATVFRIVTDGAAATIQPLFGTCTGVLVSDRATVFSFWNPLFRQVCWAHLLRKFVSFSERAGPAGEIGRDLLAYGALIFRYWHDLRDGKLSREQFKAWMAPLRLQVEACLERAVAAELAHVSGSCSDILAHREALWTFAERSDVEPTSWVEGRRGGRRFGELLLPAAFAMRRCLNPSRSSVSDPRHFETGQAGFPHPAHREGVITSRLWSRSAGRWLSGVASDLVVVKEPPGAVHDVFTPPRPAESPSSPLLFLHR
jgi:hypothetical protein